MLIIASGDMPLPAKERLSHEGDVLWLDPQPMVYDSIQCHPDIFFCPVDGSLVASPLIPGHWRDILESHGVNLVYGETVPSGKYPQTAGYNAVVTGTSLIHNRHFTDPSIKNLAADRQFIHVAQGYARCNLLPLGNNHFITSDAGIGKALEKAEKEVLLVNPTDIVLSGHKHGFFGGAFGFRGKELFVCGSLDCFADGEKVRAFANSCGFTITELCGGQLTDVGSIIFVESSMSGETYPQL